MTKPQKQDDKRWKYGELAIDDILDAAASIIRQKGVGALTMRGLAKELSISPMSAYHYVTDKNHLLKLLIDRMLMFTQVPEEGVWRERIRSTYINTYKHCTVHPGLMVESQSYYGVGEGGRITKEVVAVLREAGFGKNEVNAWVMAVTHYLMGFVQWEWTMRESQKDGKKIGFLGHYKRGLDVLLDGLEAKESGE